MFPVVTSYLSMWPSASEADVTALSRMSPNFRSMLMWLLSSFSQSGSSRITPGESAWWRGLRLRFVCRRTGPSLLGAEGRLNTKGQAVVSRSKTR